MLSCCSNLHVLHSALLRSFVFFQYELVVKYCGTHCFLHKHSSFVRSLSRFDVGAISWRCGRSRYRGLGQVRQLWPRPRLAKRQRGTPSRPEQIRRRLVRGGGERQRLDLRQCTLSAVVVVSIRVGAQVEEPRLKRANVHVAHRCEGMVR